MTTDTILACAQAGYRRYYFGRPGHQWETEGNATQILWEQLAARVLNGEYTTGRECHEFYVQLHANRVDWSDLSTRARMPWVGVLAVMQAVPAKEAA